MAFEKVVEARLWGVTTQNATVRLTMGDSSGGTFTRRDNRLRGTLLWDRCMFVLQNVAVAGGATGGSYTVTIETDAIRGFTGLPIAQATLGPNSPTTVVMDSLHQSPSAPLPTHMNINQTAAGGGLTLTCDTIAKQYRGTLNTPGRTAERIVQGPLLNADADWTIDATYAVGTSASSIGMNRLRLWDNALFWVHGLTVTGTWDADIIANVGGNTVSIASTGTGGALNVDGEKLALANSFYGQCPNPASVIITEGSAGTVEGGYVIGIAKSGRGSLAKN